MFLLDNILPFYFFIALFVGFFITYTFTPAPKIIYKYPTPDNINKVTYIDNVDNCFKYSAQKVNCPVDKTKITNIPIQ